MVKPAAGHQSLACSSPEAVRTTGTVAKTTPPTINPRNTADGQRRPATDGGHGGETLAAALAAYRYPNKTDGYAVYTDMVPGASFRGQGSSQTTFAIEALGKKLGLDPFELRRRNMIRA